MLDFQNPWLETYPENNNGRSRRSISCFKEALKLFQQARDRAFFYRLKNAVLRRLGRLFDLNSLPLGNIRSRHYSGIRAVPIAQIFGTLGRSEDFDNQFHPLTNRSRDRWVAIAMVRFQNQPLDAVKLIQVGNRYFVEDGHHRISVARALGQAEIDAEVTVWEFGGTTLPWDAHKADEKSTTASRPQEVYETALSGG
ncbi:MAG: hypothetical protein AB1522_14530 [Chloroflexota bacterium]